MRPLPVAIVTSGGGMRCAYSAGALKALGKKLDIKDPDIFVSASGSVGTMLYFLAGQIDEGEVCWTRYLPSPSFIRYFPFPAVDIDYAVDTIFRKRIPLDVKKLQATGTRYSVPVTNFDTGETRFISNDTWFDPYEVMRAAKAVPLLFNRRVFLGVGRFIDGDMSTSVEDLVKEAAKRGAKKILVITNHEPQSRLVKGVLRSYARTERKALKDALIRDTYADESIEAPEGTELLVIRPRYPLPVSVITRNPRKVSEAFQMGYDDLMAKRDSIRKLFES